MGDRRASTSWVQKLLVTTMAVAILAVSFNGEAVAAAQQPPDTNVLCVSKCGTCPTVCSSPPPPASSSSSSGEYNPVLSPPKGTGSGSGGGGGSPSSPSAPSSGEANRGRPSGSNYYYFFTSGSSHGCMVPGTYALMLQSLVSLVAVFSP